MGGAMGTAPPFLTLTLDGVVSFTPQSFYPQGMWPQPSLDRRLGGPQSWLWRRQNVSPLPGIEPRFLGHPACSLVGVPTQLSRLVTAFK
jgi:hypothetical protein